MKGESRAVGSSNGFQDTVLRQVTGVSMSNTAEILNFPAVVSGIQEQRVADTDDGYTRLANELYEELIGANLTKIRPR